MSKYPNIKVRLSGMNGNAFAVLGAVTGAMRRAKVSDADVALFKAEAISGDYDHLLRTCMEWVDVS